MFIACILVLVSIRVPVPFRPLHTYINNEEILFSLNWIIKGLSVLELIYNVEVHNFRSFLELFLENCEQGILYF